MKTYKVAILGATGAVGQEMIKILMERSFPIRELHLLASARSAGKKLTIADKEYIVEETTENSFDGMDIVLGAAENDIAEKYLPIAAEKGAVVVDNSSAFRLDEQVPLIIPEVNPQAVREHHCQSKLCNDYRTGCAAAAACICKCKAYGRFHISGCQRCRRQWNT